MACFLLPPILDLYPPPLLAPAQSSNLITEPVTVYNMMITYGSAHDIIRNPCEWDAIGTAVYDMELMQKWWTAVHKYNGTDAIHK